MNEFEIKIDTDNEHWITELDITSLFPSHYIVRPYDTDSEVSADVTFPMGAARFSFEDTSVTCVFDFLDQDEILDEELSEFDRNPENIISSLMDYLVDKLEQSVGTSVTVVGIT